MINVTKTFLPPIEEYKKYLNEIWGSGWITNNGPLVQELEQKLKEYLDVKHLFFVSNGTIALQIAIKALELRGEIITTPFSYVATTSSIVWEGCTPVFVDIDPVTLTINPELIESAITEKTSAILSTHVYGFPCHVEKLEAIAKRNNLKIIYDAAHTFGAKYKDKHLVNFGDISTLSFHATKIFHTVEGGAIITNNDELAFKVDYMRRFGHDGPEKFWGLGINGKNSELHAAMGLAIFPYIDRNIKLRRELVNYYKTNLKLPGLEVFTPQISNFSYNFGYLPVIFENNGFLQLVYQSLKNNKIFPRRYFFPSLNKLPYVENNSMEVSESFSERILCLPLYESLERNEIKHIVRLITECSKEWQVHYS